MRIIFIFIIVVIVYAFIGCELYGEVDKGEVVDDLINFNLFPTAMLTLFKCVSGDNWRTIMTDY